MHAVTLMQLQQLDTYKENSEQRQRKLNVSLTLH